MNRQTLEELVEQGLTLKQISEATGIHWQSLRYWLRKYTLKTKRRHCCMSCGQDDPEEFKKNRYTICQDCMSIRERQRLRRLKELSVEYKGGKCCRCGYSKCLAALDFHHRDPMQKDPRWRGMRGYTITTIKPELDKCDLLCANCHKEEHFPDRELLNFKRLDGTRSPYPPDMKEPIK